MKVSNSNSNGSSSSSSSRGKARVVVVGAGMAGLSTAYHLLQPAGAADRMHVTVLEAGARLGGRICTTEIGGDRVELGATWIHGIGGSPVYEVAGKIGALIGDVGWERRDGFPGPATPVTEGGGIVADGVAELVGAPMELCAKLMKEAREGKGSSTAGFSSVGEFLQAGFDGFFSALGKEERDRAEGNNNNNNNNDNNNSPPWSPRSVQEAAFDTNLFMERIMTAADSLHQLDLAAEAEYREFTGEHITIAKGYSSVLSHFTSSLPPGSIRLGAKVNRIVWNQTPSSFSSSAGFPSSPAAVATTTAAPVKIICDDGSVFEADHVVITVSLGVLKAVVSASSPNCSLLSFEPGLPPSKAEPIARLGFGVVNKLFLRVNADADADEVCRLASSNWQLLFRREPSAASAVPRWMRKTYSICPIYEGSRVLLCWFAGEEAKEMESLSTQELADGVSHTLSEFGILPSRKPMPSLSSFSPSSSSSRALSLSSSCSDASSSDSEGSDAGLSCSSSNGGGAIFSEVLKSGWAGDPLFLGSYSYVAAGASGLDIEALAEPLPECGGSPSPLQLLFAGEATERHFYSTTHGAFLSGRREADRLLHHYGLPRHPAVHVA